MQGWRKTMEDMHICILDLDGSGTALFGIFDGHGGIFINASSIN